MFRFEGQTIMEIPIYSTNFGDVDAEGCRNFLTFEVNLFEQNLSFGSGPDCVVSSSAELIVSSSGELLLFPSS